MCGKSIELCNVFKYCNTHTEQTRYIKQNKGVKDDNLLRFFSQKFRDAAWDLWERGGDSCPPPTKGRIAPFKDAAAHREIIFEIRNQK